MEILNKFKAALSPTKVQYGIWNGIPHSYAAEILGGAGFDFVVIDAEHGIFDINPLGYGNIIPNPFQGNKIINKF